MTTDADFGRDLVALDSLDTTRTVTGIWALLYALGRRLSTARGRLLDDPDYGFDVREYLSEEIDVSNPRTLLELQGGARAECMKDDRVGACTVRATFLDLARRLTIEVLGESSEGPFELTLGVSAVTVEILKGGPR